MRLHDSSHTAGFINYYLSSWISAINITDDVNVSIQLVEGSQSAYEVKDSCSRFQILYSLQIFYVEIQFEAPPPRAAVLEHSIDGGHTYQPLKHFASADDCSQYFGDNTECITEYSRYNEVASDTFTFFNDSQTLSTPVIVRENIHFIADRVQLRMRDFLANTNTQDRYHSISRLLLSGR